MSGRDLFTYNPELVGQDEEDMEGGVAFERNANNEEDNDEVNFVTIFIFSPLTIFSKTRL